MLNYFFIQSNKDWFWKVFLSICIGNYIFECMCVHVIRLFNFLYTSGNFEHECANVYVCACCVHASVHLPYYWTATPCFLSQLTLLMLRCKFIEKTRWFDCCTIHVYYIPGMLATPVQANRHIHQTKSSTWLQVTSSQSNVVLFKYSPGMWSSTDHALWMWNRLLVDRERRI